MAYPQLNRDVYSHILSFISAPNDLLAISLANKELKDLAEPELSYRCIRCRLENNAVWEHLISNPAHASRVRELTIEREDQTLPLDELTDLFLLAPEFDTPPSPKIHPAASVYTRRVMEQSESLLIQAVRGMVNLESFTWDRGLQTPLIHEGKDVKYDLTDNSNAGLEVYREDIWTVLKDYTSLRRLKAVDLGRYCNIFPDSLPIFNSMIFSLRNLTHVNLQLSSNNNDDDDDGYFGEGAYSDGEDLHATIEVLRLRDLLIHCPDLEILSLDFIKANYNPYSFYGSPFMDITAVFSNAHWPQLRSLGLTDVVIRNRTMAKFLRIHPNLRMLSASLALMSHPTKIPFDLEKCEFDIQGIHSKLEQIDLDPPALRPLLRAMGRQNCLRSISYLEPCDWDADSPLQISGEDVYAPSLDDSWSLFIDEKPAVPQNLLLYLPCLTSLTVRNVTTFSQLEKLIKSTPNIQHIRMLGHGMVLDNENPHTDLLQYFSHWPELVAYEGHRLWPLSCYESLELDSGKALRIAQECIAVCPHLREVLWRDEKPVKFTFGEDGNLFLTKNSQFDFILAKNH